MCMNWKETVTGSLDYKGALKMGNSKAVGSKLGRAGRGHSDPLL